MLRVQSRLLGRLPSSLSAPCRLAPAAGQRVAWISSSFERSSSSWLSVAHRRSQILNHPPVCWGSRLMTENSALAFLTVPRAASHRYATLSVDGGGGGGSFDGGGGNGGGSGDGAGSGPGDQGKWRVWTWYLGLLDSNPILTKAVTSAILTFIGDVFCQFVLEKTDSLDGRRVAVMTFLGFALVGPTLHYWYTTLSKFVTIGGLGGVGIRLILDQFLFSPIFIAAFMSSLMTLEGNPKQIVAKLKQDWWSAVLVNWQLWIPAQIVNFWLVPLKLQVAFANFTALFWNAYLSYKSHLEVAVSETANIEAKT